MTNHWDRFEWDNRMDLEHHSNISDKFHSKRDYQKLSDKLELKHIRHKQFWLMKSTFIRTIFNLCWNARYEMR